LKINILVLLLAECFLSLSACAQSSSSETTSGKNPTQVLSTKAPNVEIVKPTATATVASNLYKEKILKMNEETFVKNVSLILMEISAREATIGNQLSQCDLAISNGSESLHGVSVTGNNNCVIALVREKDYSVPGGLWSDFAPKDGNHIVAATTTMNGHEYPFVVIVEGEYDSEYYIRVLAHEGVHLIRIKSELDCPDDSPDECRLNEEVLAYQTQFKFLEEYLKSKNLMGIYQNPKVSVSKYSLKGVSSGNKTALEMEHELYIQNKAGKLAQFLKEISY
jgi:hypothetical protein